MSAPKRWLELSVRAHQEAAETVAALLHKWGEGGVAIFQEHVQESVDHDPRPVGAWLTLTSYLPDSVALASRRDGLERDLWHLHAFHGDLVGESENAVGCGRGLGQCLETILYCAPRRGAPGHKAALARLRS